MSAISERDMKLVDAYWRAANYLSVGQIYLLDNPLLRRPLTPDDMRGFEASLASDGLKFDEIRSGAFLTKAGDEPGKPCLMLERLYLAIARLPEETRRKIYAGMFFLGRDK